MAAYDNLILHRAEGSFAGAESWMQNPNAQVSAHFLCDHQTGQLLQLVDTADEAWAEASGNPRNISVEISGVTTDPIQPACVVTLGKLHAWCHMVHGVALRINDDPTPGRSGLGWHGMGGVAWGNHPDCPGDIVKNARDAIVGEAARDLGTAVATVGTLPPCIGSWTNIDGTGYWQVGDDGGVFTFGQAHFAGSLGGRHLDAPIVAMIVDPKGRGYWLVGADGGVFCFGVPFFGSLGAAKLTQPIVGGHALPDGTGYRLVGRDYGEFDFGSAKYFGSANQPK